MNIQIDLPPSFHGHGQYSERQVALFTPDQNRRLMRYAKRSNVAVSRLLREITMQVLEAEEQAAKCG